MDAFTYNYKTGTNRLQYVTDAATASANWQDLKSQPVPADDDDDSMNYGYN